MKMPKKSMKASKNTSKTASMKAAMTASTTDARINSWHVNTQNIKEIWVEATVVSKRPPLKSDRITFKVFGPLT